MTGFQIRAPAGGSNAVPYFHVARSNGPWFAAPLGAVFRALLSVPAGAASGNFAVPAVGLFTYGSAEGAGGGAGACGDLFCSRLASAPPVSAKQIPTARKVRNDWRIETLSTVG